MSLTDDASSVNYDRNMFIIQATGGKNSNLYLNAVHFSIPLLIRHLWQLKGSSFPA